MNCTATRLPYRQTNAFSKIALDYIDQAEELKPFYCHTPSLQGIQKAIESRKQFSTNREVLVQELSKQYIAVTTNSKVLSNITSLSSSHTFTITTAHQNNIFTGPLYFIYKIVHAIKLADHLNNSLPAYHFVPVYYMGSEDADLEELNHIWLGGEKLTWETKQTGAVGRMKVDKQLVKQLDAVEGQLAVLPNGQEIVSLLREQYKEGISVADATFHFVNHLFADYGLIILQPDNAALKALMTPVFEDDLLHQTASGIVEATTDKLEAAGYKVQANPREINLFYLEDGVRGRLIRQGEIYKVQDTAHSFSTEALLKELRANPDRFSPNVILRGLYQETILPNIAFIGGGGETAYWLQLKDLFEHYNVPFPALVLRNSFLIAEKKWLEKIENLHFTIEDFFLAEEELLNKLVERESSNNTKLNGALTELESLYENFKQQASVIDSTLEKHVDALKTKTVYRLQELEKKMLRAEKRKFTDQKRQIHAVKEYLFPGAGLQERKDNLAYYYALWGRDFIRAIYDASLNLEQEFVIISIK